MWLIDRHSDGLSNGRISLPAPVRTALVRWYVGQGSRHDEAAGITLIQQARVGAKWIACDCLGVDRPPPILTPAFLSEAETYYLRRLTSTQRPEHVPDCPFFRDQATNRLTETGNVQRSSDPPAGYFEVLRPTPEKLAQRPDDDGSDDRTRNAPVPRLARLLWRLLNSAGRNHAPALCDEPAGRTITDEFRALSGAAANIEIAPGIELGRAFWTHGKALHSKRAYANIRELARRWPSGHAPQGFLALFAQKYKGSTVYAAGCDPLTIVNRIQSPSVRASPVKGPYLVIIVVGQYPEAHGYAPLRAYAQPVFSGNRFMPVETDFEREVLRVLLETRHRFSRHGIDIIIEKPVFDRLTPLGPRRPDFLLLARSRHTGETRQLIIQLNGPSSLQYSPTAASEPGIAQISPIVLITPRDLLIERVWEILATKLF